MKKIALFVAVVMAVLMPAMAVAGDDFSVSVSSQVWSRYLSTVGGVSHNKPVIQSDILVSHRATGFYAYVWHSAGLENDNLSSDFGDKLYLATGWMGNVGKYLLDTGLAYQDCYPVLQGLNVDEFMPFAEIRRSVKLGKHTLTPYGRIEVNLPTAGLDSGIYGYAGLRHVWQIAQSVQLKQKADFLYDTGSFGAPVGLIGRYEAGLSWRAFKVLSLEPILVKMRTPISSMRGRNTQFAVGAGASLYF